MMFMKKENIWKNTVKTKNLPALSQNMQVDYLIIGGGLTGISTLYQLQKNNLNAILVERNTCGMAVTAKSTAKITYLQEDIYQKITKSINQEAANTYLKSQIEAINLLTTIIKEEQITCDLKKSPSYLFTNNTKNIKKLNKAYTFFKNNNINIQQSSTIPLNINIIKALYVEDTYTFNPLKYICHLKNKLSKYIYENSSCLKIAKTKTGYECLINNHKVLTKNIIIATHYPSFLMPLMPLKCHIETSYISALPQNNSTSFNAINLDNPCLSFRTYQKDTLIYLNKSLNACNIKNIDKQFANLKKYNPKYIWSNKDIISNDYLPLIGTIDQNNTIFIATGYNTWGMTNATLAGKIIANIILKRNNEYISLLNPKRALNLGQISTIPLDIASNIKSFVKSNRFNTNNKNVTYTKINDQNVAIYKDKNNQEHIVLNRCPHLKCGLIFNETEQTWDCICHGSRFDIDGNCLEGPSNYNIKFKEF